MAQNDMLLVEVPRRKVVEVLGLVRGSSVRARAVGRDIQAGVRFAAAAVIILALAGWLGVGCSGRGEEASSSLPRVVLTPSAWPDGPDVLTFAVIGDFGTGDSDQFRVAAQMDRAYQEQPYEYLLSVGDNAYDGTVAERAAEVIDRPYRPLFDAGVSFRPTLGNHDHDDDYLPVTLSGLGMPRRYYRFSDGPVDFFALDSNWMDGDQLAWLEKGLSCSDSRWQVVYLHHPMYSSGKHGSDIELREVLEPVLVRGGADVLLAGHEHNYERTSPREGIVHIVTGGGGQELRDVGSSDFTAVSTSELHFLLVEVVDDSMEFKAINVDGAIIDSFSIEPRSSLASCDGN